MIPYQSDPDLAALANPATPAADLQQIAARRPELSGQILAHPNCHPSTAEWIRANSGGAQSSPAPPAGTPMPAGAVPQSPPTAPVPPGGEPVPGAPTGPPAGPPGPPVHPGAAPPAAKPPRGPKRPGEFSWKRFGWMSAMAVLLAVALIGGGTFLGWYLNDRNLANHPALPGPSVVTVQALDYEPGVEAMMPDVRGLAEDSARQVLIDSGVPADLVTTAPIPWAGEPGTVVEQTPAFGTVNPESVELSVSVEATVPEWQGKTASQFVKELQALGAEVELTSRYDAAATVGNVLEVAPEAGQHLPDLVTVVAAEPGVSVYLANLRSVDNSCSSGSLNLNGTAYDNSLSCSARANEARDHTWIASRAADRLTGVLGVPDESNPADSAVVDVIADGTVVATYTAQYGATVEIDAKVTGALRVTIRLRDPVAESSYSNVRIGFGDLRFTGGAGAMARLGEE